MDFLKISNVKVGDIICVKEPQQRFSHDCYIFRGIKKDMCILEMYNDDGDDGIEIDFPMNEIVKCEIWNPEQFGEM